MGAEGVRSALAGRPKWVLLIFTVLSPFKGLFFSKPEGTRAYFFSLRKSKILEKKDNFWECFCWKSALNYSRFARFLVSSFQAGALHKTAVYKDKKLSFFVECEVKKTHFFPALCAAFHFELPSMASTFAIRATFASMQWILLLFRFCSSCCDTGFSSSVVDCL